MFLIYSAHKSELQERPAFWSNEYGWVGWPQADRFTEAERKSLRLPRWGEWVEKDVARRIFVDFVLREGD